MIIAEWAFSIPAQEIVTGRTSADTVSGARAAVMLAWEQCVGDRMEEPGLIEIGVQLHVWTRETRGPLLAGLPVRFTAPGVDVVLWPA
ncbi:hypothetical protein ABIA32_004137 [Streptacidiphilus sp. MAP12-20]|uniref:hypothetical protein n=1 Tax=Streptacidiphilus sp. MAP12-20 TaxID=3156299 RepID=UPI003513CC72